MNSLITNEILGTLAIQAILSHIPEQRLELTKALLILPLAFNKRIRSILKNKNVVFVGSRDLALSFPKDFASINNLYLDLSTTSLNTMLLSCEMDLTRFDEDFLFLTKKVFTSETAKSVGKVGNEIFLAAPRIAKILEESAADLYQNFRISL